MKPKHAKTTFCENSADTFDDLKQGRHAANKNENWKAIEKKMRESRKRIDELLGNANSRASLPK